MSWVLDAEFREFFTSLDHRWLEKFLEHRIADRRVLRLIQKWLAAGVIEDGAWTASKEGVPQGASVSPLLEFGRFAAQNRAARGLGKPETFQFLGFTHICGKSRKGRFKLKRITDSKRMQAKLHEVKTELRRRRHLPIPEQGRWLASVLRGHCNYYAVPDNSDALRAFRDRLTRHWLMALRRRSQRTRLTWERMYRLADRWLPAVRILHPWPERRFDARTQGRSPIR